MDWKTKLVLPPNYVTLQHLKELRMKEKADLELKLREEAEAEHRSRLEEEEKVRRLKEEEEKRRVEEEMRLKEEEERKMREKEEEERLRREIVRREQIIRTRTVLYGDEEDEEKEEEPSRRTARKDFKKKYLEEEGIKEEIKEEIVVSEGKQEENLIPLKKMREKEEEERLRRETVRREQIIRTRTILCGDEEDEEKEPSRRTARKDFKKKYLEQEEKLEIKQEEIVVSEGKQEEKLEIKEAKQVEISRTSRRPRRDFKKSQELLLKDQNQEEEIKEEIVVSEGKQVENLEEGKKKKKKKWGKKKKVETLGLGSQEVNETLKSETKSSEEEVILDTTKPNGIIKDRRQRKFGYRGIAAVDKVVMNQKVEEIEEKTGDLNVVDVKMKSKAEKPTSQMKKKVETLELESVKGVNETLKSETKSIEEEVITSTKPKGFTYKDRRQRNLEAKGISVDYKKVEQIEKKTGDLDVVDDKMKSKVEKTERVVIDKKEHQFRIQNIQKHGRYVHSSRNASCSSLVWLPKQV